MRAVTIIDHQTVVRECPDPEAGVGELLVRVEAAGVNNADLIKRSGTGWTQGVANTDLPGIELAGEVVGLGPRVTRFGLGDRVMGLVNGGGQAELAVVHERLVMPIPPATPWKEAGGFSEACTTAHDALFTQSGLGLGARVCVHGAAGGVGVAAVQLAVSTGASVVATVRNEAVRAEVVQLGAKVVSPDAFVDSGPFDVVLELVGAPNMSANLAALADGGRIVAIGTSAGPVAEVDLRILMRKRGKLFGSNLLLRSLEAKASAIRAVEAQVLPLLTDRRVYVPVLDTFSFSDAAAAYDRFLAGGKFGKLVLLPFG